MTNRASTPTFVAAVSILMVSCLTFGGCKGRELQKAQQEARQAKATVATLEVALGRHIDEISKLKAELDAVKRTRDELQEQVDVLFDEREKASAFARRAQEVITHLTARTDGQTDTTVALQKQIAELQSLVEEQQAIIEELQKGGPVEPIPGESPETLEPQEVLPDVNEPVDENAVG